MRRAATWIGGLAGLLTLAGALPAQETRDATVRIPSAEVRGGREDEAAQLRADPPRIFAGEHE